MHGHWQQVLKQLWGIEASLTRLNGEYDLNFLATGSRDYVLKVMRPGCEPDFIDLQCRAFDHIRDVLAGAPVPGIIHTNDARLYAVADDEQGESRIVWLMEKITGKTYADWKPHSAELLQDVGRCVGIMDRALQSFTHPALQRDFKWNLSQGGWIADHIDALEDMGKRAVIADIIHEFKAIKPALDRLPDVAIHNDVNDYNIIVDGALNTPARVTGLIDLGDMCVVPRICDLAITGAYMVLDHPDPEAALYSLVAGYHAAYPLTAVEINLIWPLLRMRLAVSVINSTLMALENPDDPYVVISQAPAWAFLQGGRECGFHRGPFAHSLRTAGNRCRPAHPELAG